MQFYNVSGFKLSGAHLNVQGLSHADKVHIREHSFFFKKKHVDIYSFRGYCSSAIGYSPFLFSKDYAKCYI